MFCDRTSRIYCLFCALHVFSRSPVTVKWMCSAKLFSRGHYKYKRTHEPEGLQWCRESRSWSTRRWGCDNGRVRLRDWRGRRVTESSRASMLAWSRSLRIWRGRSAAVTSQYSDGQFSSCQQILRVKKKQTCFSNELSSNGKIDGLQLSDCYWQSFSD